MKRRTLPVSERIELSCLVEPALISNGAVYVDGRRVREGTAKKRYLAVCGPGLPERGVIDLPLSKDPSRPGRWRASKKANGQAAWTEYERLASTAECCVVSLWPKTGRTHQLRAHLTALGCPIAGDSLYGGAPLAERSLLHAWELHLARPLDITAPLPDDFRKFTSEIAL